MNYKSLMELLLEEEKICARLQTVENILHGMEQAAQDGSTRVENHEGLAKRLLAEREALPATLYPVRLAIGAKLMEYQGMAERAIWDKLNRADATGEEGGKDE